MVHKPTAKPISEMCRQYPMNILYTLTPTGQRVILYSYNEDLTVTVDVLERFNAGYPPDEVQRVFRIKTDDLERCPLPDDYDGW